MLARRAAKFCVEPRSPFSYISHHDPQTLGKRLLIASWPERRPEFPNDNDGGGGFPRSLSIWFCLESITRRDQISRAGNPSLRYARARLCLKRRGGSRTFRKASIAGTDRKMASLPGLQLKSIVSHRLYPRHHYPAEYHPHPDPRFHRYRQLHQDSRFLSHRIFYRRRLHRRGCRYRQLHK